MMVAVVWVLVSVLSAVLGTLYLFHSKKRKIINMIPGFQDYPLIGNAMLIKSDPAEFYQQTIDWKTAVINNGVTRIWLGPVPMVQVHTASAVEVVLNSSKHIDKSFNYVLLQPWLGLGLLTSTGEKWRSRRHTLTPTFHFDILKEFLPIINQHASTLVEKLYPHLGETFDIYPYVTLTALDVICETAMGKHMDAQNNSESEYVQAVYRASELIAARQRRPWLWLDLLYYLLPSGRQFKHCLGVLHSFTDNVIRERQKEFAVIKEESESTETMAGNKLRRRYAFLDMLLQSSSEDGTLSHRDIREEVDTFMFEGHDTTSAGVAWTIFLIGRHPYVQARVHDELEQIFGCSRRDIEQEDLRKMTYLECAIKEALRIYPPVPWYARTLTEDAVLGGFEVPKGTPVMVATNVLHREELYFPDPEKYDPDRFSARNSIHRHPFAYLPFSAGPRNCIGQKFATMELKVVLATLLRHFNVESIQRPDEVAPVSELILKPSRGISVRLTARD